MTQSRDEDLLACFWELHAALVRRDGLEGRIRAGDLDADLLERSLPAAEAVITARSKMYRCLMERGWTPPAQVIADLTYDDRVLSESRGALDR